MMNGEASTATNLDLDDEPLGDEIQISRRVIKLVSGQFDLESVRNLDLSGFGSIDKIQNLSECKHLESLNLSNNQIRKMEGLDPCENLMFLNLSNNKISALEGLEKLKNLEVLWLAGNQISSLSDLACLASCPKLRDVNLKANPVSLHPEYKKTMQQTVKKLVFLDGEHVLLAVPNIKFNQETEEFVPSIPSSSNSWIQDLKKETESLSDVPLLSGMKELKTNVVELKKLLARADSLLESFGGM